MPETVPLVHYLFSRLHQLGLDSMHGVPGDYNLVALDYLKEAGLEWVGDANELNAGYAADGYARVKGIGAILTTFGVGELSAVNAIAGSYAEHVPVVHIVGSPSTLSQKDHMLLHHTLGNGDYSVFYNVYKNVTVAQARLVNLSMAPSQIDLTLQACLLERRPVYIELPTDMVTKSVPAHLLDTKLEIPWPVNNAEIEKDVVALISQKLRDAKQPVILVDLAISRFSLTNEVDQIIQKTGLPTFVTPMGKGVVDESLENFGGVYAGSGSYDDVRVFVESSDLVLGIAILKSDFNTSGFSFRISQLNRICINIDHTIVGAATYDLHIASMIRALANSLNTVSLKDKPSFPKASHQERAEASADIAQVTYPSGTITHDYLWPSLSNWLQPNDIIVAETGTSNIGIWDTTLPPGATVISQTLWASIGYTLPAAQGAALAARELDRTNEASQRRRVILFEGDGSAQLTAQAIGTMLRLNLDIVIILINNDGYTIERWVHGMEAAYNDIPRWRYSLLPEAMGATVTSSDETSPDATPRHGRAQTCQIKTVDELEAFWRRDDVRDLSGKGMQFVEMFMPKEDAPLTLKMFCTAAAAMNAKQ